MDTPDQNMYDVKEVAEDGLQDGEDGDNDMDADSNLAA